MVQRKNWELTLVLLLLIVMSSTIPSRPIYQILISLLIFTYWIIWVVSIEVFLWNAIDPRLRPRRLDYFISMIIFLLSVLFGFTIEFFAIKLNLDTDIRSIIIIFSLLFMFYAFYHVSTLIVAAEKERKVSFREQQTVFLFLLIFFLGFLFLQPRINKLSTKYLKELDT